jgi:hypothetical protein
MSGFMVACVMPRFRAFVWLWLALASCDKREEPKAATSTDPGTAKTTRSTRPSRAELTELRDRLHVELGKADAIRPAEEREKSIAQVAWNALETDPELALEAFQHLTADSPEKIRLIQHLAMRLAEKNLDEALAWADSLGSEKEISAAKARIALVLSATDAPRAAVLLSDSGLAGRDFDVAVVQVLQRWSADTPRDAAEWVVLFPPGNSRVAGIKTVVSQWTKSDAGAVLSWMATTRDLTVRSEIALAMQLALLRQPQAVREEWLSHADPAILQEIEQQKTRAVAETGSDSQQPSP